MRLEHITKTFAGRRVLDDLTYEFDKGITAITGPSGVGKSTLINIAAGLVKPDAGRVVREKNKMSLVFQEDRLIENITAPENLCFVAGKGALADARLLLSELGLTDDLERPVSKFSGGMKRRVAIARALIVNPDVLLMDEPFRGLDESSRANAARIICARGIPTIIFVTHDRSEMALMGAEHELKM